MTEAANPEIDVEQLMMRIREEVARWQTEPFAAARIEQARRLPGSTKVHDLAVKSEKRIGGPVLRR